jgi:hypothetical protein
MYQASLSPSFEAAPEGVPAESHFDLALDLRPFVLEATQAGSFNAGPLWGAVEKRGGLEHLFYDTGRKFAKAKRTYHSKGEAYESLYRAAAWRAFWIRGLLIPLSWLEKRFSKGGPQAHWPFLRTTLIWHYELFSAVDAMGA